MRMATATTRPGDGLSAAITEAAWQRQITDLAEILGWQWAHFRPAQTAHGWRTPVSGPIGAGWPDLMLARRRDGRFLLVETKAARGVVTAAQREVHDLLRACGLTVYVWRPGDFDTIAEVLR